VTTQEHITALEAQLAQAQANFQAAQVVLVKTEGALEYQRHILAAEAEPSTAETPTAQT